MLDTILKLRPKCYIHPGVLVHSLLENPLGYFSGIWKISSRAHEYLVYTKQKNLKIRELPYSIYSNNSSETLTAGASVKFRKVKDLKKVFYCF